MGMNPDAINSEADVAEDQSASRMDPKIKAQWVAALRSGEYKQGKGVLRKGNELCCLGVLCEVAILSGIELKVHHKNGYTQYDGHGSGLPGTVREWAGLDDGQPYTSRMDDDGFPMRISHVNDGGASFEQIADLIEAEF